MKTLSTLSACRFSSRPRSSLLAASVLMAVLATFETASAVARGCVKPGCIKTFSPFWAPTSRPEMLVTSWNTPVAGTETPHPAPAPEGSGPIAVSLSQSVIDDEFFGILDLTIEGLSLGQSVRVEKFRLDNDRGELTEGSVLIESHRITDGIAVRAGEVYNFNLLNDVTPRDGRIEAQLDFWEPDVASISGEYLYRVSSPLGSFPARSVRLTVTETVTPQKITGTVTSGGQPLANAIVCLLDPLADTKDFIKGTTTDANGAYTLYAPYQDEFELLAVKEGYVGPFSVGTETIVEEGQDLTVDLVLEEGTRTISGTLIDETSGDPLPGVQLFLFPADERGYFDFTLLATTTTGPDGGYEIRVTPGRWAALIRPQAAYKIGYVAKHPYTTLSVADATDGDVADHEIRLARGDSILWGRLFSDTFESTEPENLGEPLPLCGVEVYAYDHENDKLAWGVTDGDGCYRIAVTPGRWEVLPYPLSLPNSGHAATPAKELTVTADNQSILHDFFCRPAAGTVIGTVTDEEFNPIGGLSLLALNTDLDNDEKAIQMTYASDGFYFFDLPEGTWITYPDAFGAAHLAKLFLDLPTFTIDGSGGEDPITAHIDVEDPTATIEITLTDLDGNPIPDAYLHGSSQTGGVAIDSFAATDETGVARLPAAPGEWELHFSDNYLRHAGMQALPAFHVSVSGPLAQVAMQATPLTNRPAEITSVRVTDIFDLVIEGTAESGQTYVVEASRDLEDWFSIGSLRAVDGRFKVVDPWTALFEDQAYYRLVTKSLGF